MNADQAKFLADHYAATLENEFKATCRVLEAVTDAGKSYKPDDKSRTAWELATHIATADIWFLDAVINARFAGVPEGGDQSSQFSSVAEVVAFYKQSFPEKLRQLRAQSGENLAREVDFFSIMKQPAAAFLALATNHSMHHRGQLAAYLRALGSKVPAIYGASADEPVTPGGN
jgi:uncharacterized damage-inducible protein DinB